MNNNDSTPATKPVEKKLRCDHTHGRRRCILNAGRHQHHKYAPLPGRWTNR